MKIDGGEDRICVVEAFYLALMGQIKHYGWTFRPIAFEMLRARQSYEFRRQLNLPSPTERQRNPDANKKRTDRPHS